MRLRSQAKIIRVVDQTFCNMSALKDALLVYQTGCHAGADEGEKYAQFNLAHAYQIGRGVPKDGTEALKCFRVPPNREIFLLRVLLPTASRMGRALPRMKEKRFCGFGKLLSKVMRPRSISSVKHLKSVLASGLTERSP